MAVSGPGLFCDVVERLRKTAWDECSLLADRAKAGALHVRRIHRVETVDGADAKVVAGAVESAVRTDPPVPFYGRNSNEEWRTITHGDVVREPQYNSRSEMIGVRYPDCREYGESRKLWTGQLNGGDLLTPQAYLKNSDTGAVDIRLDRPFESLPFSSDPNVISLHAASYGEYAFLVDRTPGDPYGTDAVLLGPATAGRFIREDDIFREVTQNRKGKESVVDACFVGSDEKGADSFADALRGAGATGDVHFPTDLIGVTPLRDRSDGREFAALTVVANYGPDGKALPTWYTSANKVENATPSAE